MGCKLQTTERMVNDDFDDNDILTFMPSQRDTALSGRKARNVRRARNAPMLPIPIPSAPRLISDICTEKRKIFTPQKNKYCVTRYCIDSD